MSFWLRRFQERLPSPLQVELRKGDGTLALSATCYPASATIVCGSRLQGVATWGAAFHPAIGMISISRRIRALRYTRHVDSSRLRRWVQDKRVVEARERAEARSAAACSRDAIAQALALVALYGRLHGWPAGEDEVSRREDAQMYDRWHRLRTALRRAR